MSEWFPKGEYYGPIAYKYNIIQLYDIGVWKVNKKYRLDGHIGEINWNIIGLSIEHLLLK